MNCNLDKLRDSAAHFHTSLYVCVSVCVCVCVCTHTYMYILLYTYIQYVCVYVYMCIHMCVYVCLYMYIYATFTQIIQYLVSTRNLVSSRTNHLSLTTVDFFFLLSMFFFMNMVNKFLKEKFFQRNKESSSEASSHRITLY